ncbi:hypothetical protein Chor_001580 [Crotalus horridus]
MAAANCHMPPRNSYTSVASPCQCPTQSPPCPLGNSLSLDDCGCCKVCSLQLGELCLLQEPCDHHKGLYCDFSKTQKDRGICLVYRNKLADKHELKLKSTLNDLQVNCLVQTTGWSACSKTCGMGISVCVTNNNPQCELEKESRLCLVQFCNASLDRSIKFKITFS